MRVRRVSTVEAIAQALVDAELESGVSGDLRLAAFVAAPKKKKGGGMAARSIKRFRLEFQAMLLDSDFRAAACGHLVAMHEWAHTEVYGAAPGELDPKAWLHAAAAAGRMLKTEFADDIGRMVDYVRWTWKRELGRETRRRNGLDLSVGRIGWRIQFGMRYLLTDYRIDLARRGANVSSR